MIVDQNFKEVAKPIRHVVKLLTGPESSDNDDELLLVSASPYFIVELIVVSIKGALAREIGGRPLVEGVVV